MVLPAPLVDQIVAYAVEHPTEGPRTIAARLALPRFGSWRVSRGGVYNVLRRAGLARRSARLAAAEALAASEGGPITERVLRDLRAGRSPTVTSARIPPVSRCSWTRCPWASSRGWARSGGTPRWTGPAPSAAPPPERLRRALQGIVLHLHDRVAFRYRFSTRAEDIDADLQAFLRSYNFERPHRGYRTRGRRPAEIFYAHRPDLLEMEGWDADGFTPRTVRS